MSKITPQDLRTEAMNFENTVGAAISAASVFLESPEAQGVEYANFTACTRRWQRRMRRH
jgi:hypothetical protein